SRDFASSYRQSLEGRRGFQRGLLQMGLDRPSATAAAHEQEGQGHDQQQRPSGDLRKTSIEQALLRLFRHHRRVVGRREGNRRHFHHVAPQGVETHGGSDEALYLVDGDRRRPGLGAVVYDHGQREPLDGARRLGDRGHDPVDAVLTQYFVLRVLVLTVPGGDDSAVDAESPSRSGAGAGELLFHRLFLESERFFLAEGLALRHPLVEVELSTDDDGRTTGTEDGGQKRREVLGEQGFELPGLPESAASHSGASGLLARRVEYGSRGVGDGHVRGLQAFHRRGDEGDD